MKISVVMTCSILLIGVVLMWPIDKVNNVRGWTLLRDVSRSISRSLKETRFEPRSVTLRKQARILVQALNDYYLERGEYPPYLLGGEHTEELADYEIGDPLLAGGYLDGYPMSAAFEWQPPPPREDPRAYVRVRNLASAPKDPLVMYYKEMYVDESAFSQLPSRFFCAGGYRGESKTWTDGHRNIETEFYLSALPTPVFEALRRSRKSRLEFTLVGFRVRGEFGYQRGDFIEMTDGDPQEAWLWFYGFEGIQGLDLVDNDDGLIQPDGIPDGIVVLYKLKEGEVIEVVKKYD